MQLKVSISSRMEELSEERAAVGEAVSELWKHENLPFTIWRWESAKEIPSGKHPDKVQSKGVRDSNIYVLILASEYGDFEYEESPTHREYKTACSELEEDCILIYIKEVERREEKLEKWIEEIKNKHTFKSFVNTYQLKDLVKTRLRDLGNKGKWKVSMPTIQSVLRKGETFEGDFFKKEPEWIDFEEGFVVERKEVAEIIKKLESDNIQLVLGEPASGKSVILKHIGFKLANENKDVYVVELKKHSGDEVKRYFADIPEIKDEKAVFIIDDAHLQFAECERLVREFKNRGLKVKLIIGSRKTREMEKGYPKEALEFEYLPKTEIRPENVTEEMIKRFLEKKYGFTKERIEAVSGNFERRFKKDLWYLSWALKAYNPEKDLVKDEEIHKRIKDSIRNINAGKDKPKINAADVFFLLSVFYKFEIPVERNFLREKAGIDENIINQLIGLSEIVETEEIGKRKTLSLIHSSIANLYFITYLNYPSLGEKIKSKFQEMDKDIVYSVFYQYIKLVPINTLDVLIYLYGDLTDLKGGRTLLKKLMGTAKGIENSIAKAIVGEKDVVKVVACMEAVSFADKRTGLKLAKLINLNALASKADKEEDIVKIGWCVRGISSASKEAGLKLAKLINLNILISKIEKEEYMLSVARCVRNIAFASEQIGLKLTNAVAAKIGKEKYIGYIGLCVKFIGSASNKVGLKLTNLIDVDILRSKLEKTIGLVQIARCVRNIASVDKKLGSKLIDIVGSRIEKEEDIGYIGLCVAEGPYPSKEIAEKIANRINVNNLVSKMEKEGDILKIGGCLKDFASVNKEVARKIANRINIDNLSSKIEKEESTGTIQEYINRIAEVSPEAAGKIFDHLKAKTRKKHINK